MVFNMKHLFFGLIIISTFISPSLSSLSSPSPSPSPSRKDGESKMEIKGVISDTFESLNTTANTGFNPFGNTLIMNTIGKLPGIPKVFAVLAESFGDDIIYDHTDSDGGDKDNLDYYATISDCLELMQNGTRSIIVDINGDEYDCNAYLFSTGLKKVYQVGTNAFAGDITGFAILMPLFNLVKPVGLNLYNAYNECLHDTYQLSYNAKTVKEFETCYDGVRDSKLGQFKQCSVCMAVHFFDEELSIAFTAFMFLVFVGWVINTVLKVLFKVYKAFKILLGKIFGNIWLTILFITSIFTAPFFFMGRNLKRVGVYLHLLKEKDTLEDKKEDKTQHKVGNGDVLSDPKNGDMTTEMGNQLMDQIKILQEELKAIKMAQTAQLSQFGRFTSSTQTNLLEDRDNEQSKKVQIVLPQADEQTPRTESQDGK